MLGNDVVDLRDPEADPRSFRPRFDERVFSSDERRAIGHDPHPIARRWVHWAAKEAAYKLARQLDEGFVFSPGALVARFEPVTDPVAHSAGRLERRGRLELPRTLASSIRTLELRSSETPERVHVVAIPCGADWDAVDVGIESAEETPRDPSAAVRQLAIRHIARSLGVEADRLQVAKQGRIPVVELDGAVTSLVLSLSHHGRFFAFACAPRVTVPPRDLREGRSAPTLLSEESPRGGGGSDSSGTSRIDLANASSWARPSTIVGNRPADKRGAAEWTVS